VCDCAQNEHPEENTMKTYAIRTKSETGEANRPVTSISEVMDAVLNAIGNGETITIKEIEPGPVVRLSGAVFSQA